MRVFPLFMIAAIALAITPISVFSQEGIKPEKVWIKQYGSNGDDYANSIALGNDGSIYVVGNTPFLSGGADGFITKIDKNGERVWFKWLGSDDFDECTDVAVDNYGDVIVIGRTSGRMAGNIHMGGDDVFVAKLTGEGDVLWVKEFGTGNDDYASGVDTDDAGNIYVVGSTWGNFSGGVGIGDYSDSFIAKLDPSGNLVWVKQFGSIDDDEAYDVTIDEDGFVYVAGFFAGSMGSMSTAGDTDVYVAKFSGDGDIVWIRQYGSSSLDFAYGIDYDEFGHIFVVGSTGGTMPDNINAGGMDGFIMNINVEDGGVEWIKQIGTRDDDDVLDVDVDTSGYAFIVGTTLGAELTFFTFIEVIGPGGKVEGVFKDSEKKIGRGHGLAVSDAGEIYVTGTASTALPGNTHYGFNDYFVLALRIEPAARINIISPRNGEIFTGESVDVTVSWTITEGAYPVSIVRLRLDDMPWIDVTGTNSYTFTGVTGGKHTIVVSVTDTAGRVVTREAKFMVISATIEAEVHTKYNGLLFLGCRLKNKYYVRFTDQTFVPDTVYGYIEGRKLVFNYVQGNNTWVSVLNVDSLPKGSHELNIVAEYGGAAFYVGSREVKVVEVPEYILGIYQVQGGYEGEKIKLEVSTSLEVIGDGIWDNEYAFIISAEVKWPLMDNDMKFKYAGGEWELNAGFALTIELRSSGEVTLSGDFSREYEGEIGSVKFNALLHASASGDLKIENYSVELDGVTVDAGVSISGSKTFPTPWGIDVPNVGKLGVTVTLSAGIGGGVVLELEPAAAKDEYLFGVLPLRAKSMEGYVDGTVLVSGQLGSKGSVGNAKVGVFVGVAGAIGARAYTTGDYAVAGKVDAFIVAYLVFMTEEYHLTLLGPGTLAKGGNVSSGVEEEVYGLVEDKLNSMADILDWVNGSWIGYVAQNYIVGGDYSAIFSDEALNIYYTYVRPDGTSWIGAYRIDEASRGCREASIPVINGVGAASPFVFRDYAGRTRMIYAVVPPGIKSVDDLRILLQMSELGSNGWTQPINLTEAGVTLSYTSDGERVYAVWSDSLNYSRTRLLVYDVENLNLLANISIPDVYMINDALDEEAFITFTNGSVATADLGNDWIQVIEGAVSAGFVRSSGEPYIYYRNGTLALLGGQSTRVQLPEETLDAQPLRLNNTLYIAALNRTNVLVYRWSNGLFMEGAYPAVNATSFKAYAGTANLYVLTQSFNDIATQNGSLGLIIHRRPSVKIVSPEDLDILATNDVRIEWVIGPHTYPIKEVLVKLDNGTWINVTGNTSTVIENVGNGAHRVVIKVTDEFGNEALDYVNFTVASPIVGGPTTTTQTHTSPATGPSQAPSTWTWLSIVAGAVIGAFVAVAVLVWLRRSRQRAVQP